MNLFCSHAFKVVWKAKCSQIVGITMTFDSSNEWHPGINLQDDQKSWTGMGIAWKNLTFDPCNFPILIFDKSFFFLNNPEHFQVKVWVSFRLMMSAAILSPSKPLVIIFQFNLHLYSFLCLSSDFLFFSQWFLLVKPNVQILCGNLWLDMPTGGHSAFWGACCSFFIKRLSTF